MGRGRLLSLYGTLIGLCMNLITLAVYLAIEPSWVGVTL